MKIDGQSKNLKNRKFCLICSPWKKHNTHPLGADAPRKDRSGKPTKEQNKQNALSLYRRALERKEMLIDLAGGACKCGYNKSRNALSFHHRDPKEKLFGLCLNKLWNKSLDEIMTEFHKCDLLCLNCHAEIEGTKSDYVRLVNEKFGTAF